MTKRITYKDISQKYNDITSRLKKIESKLETSKSEWINFIKFRIQEINADSRIIYSAFWQKFSIFLTFILAIISIIIAVGAVAGIESVVNILNDALLVRGVIGSFIVIFVFNIIIPITARIISVSKDQECLKRYEDILSDLLFDDSIELKKIIPLIKEIERKYSSDLLSYIHFKLKQHWSNFKKILKNKK